MDTNIRPYVSLVLANLRSGGAERVMITYANELAKRGYKVDLVVGSYSGELIKEVHTEVNVHHLSFRSISSGFFPIVRYLNSRRPNFLISTLTHVNIISILACRLSIASTKIFIREATTPRIVLSQTRSTYRKAIIWLSKLIYPLAHGYIAISNFAKSEFQTFYRIRKNIHLVYNPILEERKNEIDEENMHIFFQESNKVILGIGRIVPAKDFSTLVKAFNICYHKNKKMRLLILGAHDLDIKETEKVQALINKYQLNTVVDLVGYVENFRDYLCASDVYVLSSKVEGVPGSLVHALSLGCPSVVTNCVDSIKEVTGNCDIVRVCNVGDHMEMSKAIEYLSRSVINRKPCQEVTRFEISNSIESLIMALR